MFCKCIKWFGILLYVGEKKTLLSSSFSLDGFKFVCFSFFRLFRGKEKEKWQFYVCDYFLFLQIFWVFFSFIFFQFRFQFRLFCFSLYCVQFFCINVLLVVLDRKHVSSDFREILRNFYSFWESNRRNIFLFWRNTFWSQKCIDQDSAGPQWNPDSPLKFQKSSERDEIATFNLLSVQVNTSLPSSNSRSSLQFSIYFMKWSAHTHVYWIENVVPVPYRTYATNIKSDTIKFNRIHCSNFVMKIKPNKKAKATKMKKRRKKKIKRNNNSIHNKINL